ncbi:MAG: RNA polymerase sigma factor [Verrucomicrobiales bacterium]|nr:RNA polymerase sigma factor [Verrucomicrobiales bacterium]
MAQPRDLERLYDEHAQALFAFLLNFTRDDSETRDLLQEVFTRLAGNPALLEPAREPRAFLLRLAHNLAIDRIRRRSTRASREDAWGTERMETFADTPDPDEASFREALAAALAALPPDQRAVVHLKLWEDLTFESIATLLEIPLNTAASRYRYGIDKLQARLRPIYDELQ